VIPNGVDLKVFSPEGPKFPLKTKKSFKFLFVGGSIHRKGIDIVLAAYAAAFSSRDNVVLVIKDQSGNTYGNTGITERLMKMRSDRGDLPEIEYICEPLPEPQIAALYRSCNVLVHPYRGEGYGLPIAEAMACGLPVIVTQGGAADDFVTPEVGHLIPATTKPARVQPFMAAAPGFWLLEPDTQSVATAMRSTFENTDHTLAMGRKAHDHALKTLGWHKAIELASDRIKILSEIRPIRFRARATAFVFDTTTGSNDGIAEILTSYVAEFKAEEPVSLCFVVSIADLQKATDETTNQIAAILTQLNISEFPEIRVISTARDIGEISKHSTIQWIESAPGSVMGLDGIMSHRLGASRLRYKRALEGSHAPI